MLKIKRSCFFSSFFLYFKFANVYFSMDFLNVTQPHVNMHQDTTNARKKSDCWDTIHGFRLKRLTSSYSFLSVTDELRHQILEKQMLGKESVTSLYLTTVESGNVEMVASLFDLSQEDCAFRFDRNAVNDQQKNSLRLAVEAKDSDMCLLLLHHEVTVGDNLFHAIERNFVEGVNLILKHDSCLGSKIKSENNYFSVGLTPMVLAACNNNYEILKLLHSHDHSLMKTTTRVVIENELAWEATADRMTNFEAKASPAYITLISEVNRENPIGICLNVVGELMERMKIEPELNDFYTNLKNLVENFMCLLLDQIQSSDELAKLLQYDFVNYENNETAMDGFARKQKSNAADICSMEIIEKASKLKLMKFVTHRNIQLAVEYLKYRYIPSIHKHYGIRGFFTTFIVGLFFPIWSFLYIVAPTSKFGGVLTLPIVSFSCHLMSDFMFVALLFTRIMVRSESAESPGETPPVLDWIIFLWVMGRGWREAIEIKCSGVKSYLADPWNWNDLIQLILFVIVIICRILNLVMRRSNDRGAKDYNHKYDPMYIASGLLAWAYLFAFLRILSLTKASRRLGTLQISLTKILINVLQFLCIFSFVIFAFGMGLTELFWYYKTEIISDKSSNRTIEDLRCSLSKFNGLGRTLAKLFWYLFGYLDTDDFNMDYCGKSSFITFSGWMLLGTYHVVAVIIFLNMLIAMMAISFEKVSDNKAIQWKFHRTTVWIHYFQKRCTLPPPMNLIPNPLSVSGKVKSLIKALRGLSCFEKKENSILKDVEVNEKWRAFKMRRRTGSTNLKQASDVETAANKVREDLREHLARNVEFKLLERYKVKHLVKKGKL